MGRHTPDNPGRRKDDKPKPGPAYINCPKCGQRITNHAIPLGIHARRCKGRP